MSGHVESDELFGELVLHVDRDDGLVQVRGSLISTAVVRRTGPARPGAYAPIGTRAPADLTIEVDGIAAEIVPAAGGLTRRSYRVDVRHDDVDYRLVPSTSDRSALTRDGTTIGRLWAVPDAGVSAQWRPDRGVEPSDAALGYVLAAAFGTGAQHVLVSLVTGFFHA